jgi:hypothetical protein
MKERKIGTGTYLWAIYVPGHKRINGTKKDTEEKLRTFRNYLQGNTDIGCKCKDYFGVN